MIGYDMAPPLNGNNKTNEWNVQCRNDGALEETAIISVHLQDRIKKVTNLLYSSSKFASWRSSSHEVVMKRN